MKDRQIAITRLIVTAVLLANAILTAAGKNPLPFGEEQVTEVVSYAFSAAAMLWSWWKNNNMTPEAISAQAMLDKMKEDSEEEYE